MVPNVTLVLLAMAFTSVAAQTFQYSRGWTNGKRDGHRRDEMKVAGSLERILSPCQMGKLKYVLEGKPLSEKLFGPCDYFDEDLDSQSKIYKAERSQDPLFEAYQ